MKEVEIFVANRDKRFKVLNLLLNNQVETGLALLNELRDIDKEKILSSVLMKFKLDVAEILIKKLNGKGIYASALRLALEQGNLEVADFMISHRLDVDGVYGETLQRVLEKGDFKTASWILNHNLFVYGISSKISSNVNLRSWLSENTAYLQNSGVKLS